MHVPTTQDREWRFVVVSKLDATKLFVVKLYRPNIYDAYHYLATLAYEVVNER